MQKERRTSYIENFFSVLLTKAGVSDNVFVATPPPTTGVEWNDMAYVKLEKMTDDNPYSKGHALIYLYARPTGAPARKAVVKLDKMENAAIKAIEGCNDAYYILQKQWRDNGYDDDLHFHYNVISVEVTVRSVPL